MTAPVKNLTRDAKAGINAHGRVIGCWMGAEGPGVPEISAFFVRKQIDAATRLPDKAALFASIGLTEAEAAEPATLVAAADYYALLETIAESEWPDLRFHMRVCASMRCEELGAVGLALKSAPTLRHGFRRMGRYTRIHNRMSTFAVEEKGDIYCWTHHRPVPARLGNYLSNEAALATFVTLCREASAPDLTPVRVQFAHHRDGSIDALTAHFGIEPVFGAEVDGMQFAIDDVDRKNPLGDAGIWAFFTDHLDRSLPSVDIAEDRLQQQVIEVVAPLLSGGVPQLADVAGQLGMSGRTLQRRLSDAGRTYQALVEQARRELARQLISETRYSLAEISFLTGFSEQSAFTRAFKRWEGQTPRAFRQARSSAVPVGAPVS